MTEQASGEDEVYVRPDHPSLSPIPHRQTSRERQTWERCPVCLGGRYVQYGVGTTASTLDPCKTCLGTGMVQSIAIAALEADRDTLRRERDEQTTRAAQLEIALMGAGNGVRAAERRAEETEALLRRAEHLLEEGLTREPKQGIHLDGEGVWTRKIREWREALAALTAAAVRESQADIDANLTRLNQIFPRGVD